MKRILIATAFLIGLAPLANAQFKYGPIVGGAYSAFSNYDKGAFGLQAGAFVELEILDRFSWVPEFTYTTRSSKTETTTPTGTDTDKLKMNSVDYSPIMFLVPFSNNLSARVGLRWTAWNSGTLEQTVGTTTTETPVAAPGNSRGFVIGLVYETISGLQFEARYYGAGASGEAVVPGGPGDLSEIGLNLRYAIDW